jgi:hypothetical protein
MTTTYTFKCVYKKNGVAAAPAAAPTITIVSTANVVLVNAQPVTALANMVGAYVYSYTGADDLDLIGKFLTTDGTVDEADLYSYTPAILTGTLDAAVSTRLSSADWTSGLASILAAIAGIVAAVWAYVTRTLTSTAAQTTAALTGSNFTITNRVTFAATLTGLNIPVTWEKIYLTLKPNRNFPDASAALQWLVSNPAAAGTDGIIVYSGSPGGTSRTLGALTVNQGAGTIAIGLQDDIDITLLAGDYEYDVKCLLADGTSQILTEGQATINLAVTRAV